MTFCAYVHTTGGRWANFFRDEATSTEYFVRLNVQKGRNPFQSHAIWPWCVFTYLCSIYLSIYLFVSIYLSFCKFIYLIIFQAMSVPIYLMNLSICSSIFLFYFIKIHISVSLRFDVIYRWFNVSMMSVINLNRAWHWDPNTKLFFSKEQFPNHPTGRK